MLHLIGQRLALMHDVARWKWNHDRPIHDPAREALLLDGLVERGAKHDLEPELVRAFFTAQMEASKQIQEADFRQWKAEQRERFDSVPDLSTELRPRIDQLSESLLTSLASLAPSRGSRELRPVLERLAPEFIARDAIDPEVFQQAIAPLTGAD